MPSRTAAELFPSVEPYGESSAVPSEPDYGGSTGDRPWTTEEVRPGVLHRRDSSGALRSITITTPDERDPYTVAITHIQAGRNARAARRARRRARREARRDAAQVQWAEEYLRRASMRLLNPDATDSDDSDSDFTYQPITSDTDSDSDGSISE